MDSLQTENEKVFLLPDCCPVTKYTYYREGILEMPLNCTTPCNNIVYKFRKPFSLSNNAVILHPMYGHPKLTYDTYIGPDNDTFYYYLVLLKTITSKFTLDVNEMLHYPVGFNRQKFINKRYMKIDSFDSTTSINILVLHHAYYDAASQLRTLLKQFGLTTFIFYMTDVTLEKLGNLKGSFVIFGCFNKTFRLLHHEMSRCFSLYSAWDIVYWLNKDKDIDFTESYYLNPLDIPQEYFKVECQQITTQTQIIKSISTYGTYTGLPIEKLPIQKIAEGKTGIASDYNEF